MIVSSSVRITIADDHALFRQGLRSLLERQEDIVVVAETDQLETLAELLTRTPCDILLLDLHMERRALSEIPGLAAHATVIVVTASDQVEELLAAVRAGARAVVSKRFALETLVEAVRAVTAGHVWLPPPVQAAMTTGFHEAAQGRLTPRELELVREVGLGRRNADIGKRLFISEETVKTHLKNIFPKVGVRDRTELALYAIRVGIVGVQQRKPDDD